METVILIMICAFVLKMILGEEQKSKTTPPVENKQPAVQKPTRTFALNIPNSLKYNPKEGISWLKSFGISERNVKDIALTEPVKSKSELTPQMVQLLHKSYHEGDVRGVEVATFLKEGLDVPKQVWFVLIQEFENPPYIISLIR